MLETCVRNSWFAPPLRLSDVGCVMWLCAAGILTSSVNAQLITDAHRAEWAIEGDGFIVPKTQSDEDPWRQAIKSTTVNHVLCNQLSESFRAVVWDKYG